MEKGKQQRPSSSKRKKIKVEDSNMGEHQQRQCMLLLQKLMRHKYAWVFNVPVDAEKLNLPDYHLIIKNPMDLGTVKKCLLSKRYASPLDFAADVRLTFNNALLYNPKADDVHVMALELRARFENLWKVLAEKLAITGEKVVNCNDSVDSVVNAADDAYSDGDIVATESRPAKRLRMKLESNFEHNNKHVRGLTYAEKDWLVDALEKSPDDVQIGVTHIIQENYPVVDGEEVDVMNLDNVTLWKVFQVLKSYHGVSPSTSSSAHEFKESKNTTEVKSNDATCDSTSDTRRELVEKKSNSTELRHTGAKSASSSSASGSRSGSSSDLGSSSEGSGSESSSRSE